MNPISNETNASNPPFRTFRDLECWKVCRNLRVFVAKDVCRALPKDEKYRLGDQIIRAARADAGT